MTSRRFAVAFALGSTVFACGEAPSSDVSVEVEPSQVEVACMKGAYCKPPKIYTPPIIIGGDLGVFEAATPERGPDFDCTGAGPEGNGAEYRVVPQAGDLQCWSSVPLVAQNGTIPLGFTLLSLYVCPSGFPVNRCDPFGRCTCWSF